MKIFVYDVSIKGSKHSLYTETIDNIWAELEPILRNYAPPIEITITKKTTTQKQFDRCPDFPGFD